MIAGLHEQTHTADLQDQELATLQQGAQAPRFAGDLVRPPMTWEVAPTGKRGRQRDYSVPRSRPA